MSSRNKQDFPARDFFEKFTVNARYKFKTEEKKRGNLNTKTLCFECWSVSPVECQPSGKIMIEVKKKFYFYPAGE